MYDSKLWSFPVSGYEKLIGSRRSLLKGLGAAAGVGLLGHSSGRWALASAQEATPETVQWDRDVVYGEIDGEQLLLDVARPMDLSEPLPAVIFLRGGGYDFGDRSFIEYLVPPVVEAGYVGVNIEWRLFSEAENRNLWPAQLEDSQRAVRWIRANAATYGVDPNRVGAFGTSAGGRLAAFLGTRETVDNSDPTFSDYSSRVTCVVDVSGHMDMSIPSPGTAAIDAALLGGTADQPPDDAAYLDFSPIAFVDENTVPFLILHGGADFDLPFEHPYRMVEALHNAGVDVTYREYPGLAHRDMFDWNVIGPETLAFLGRHLQSDQ